MHHICTYWYINTNTNSPTPHTHSQKFRHICTPMFISLYVENTSSYWYLQFNTIIPQGHSSFLTFRICDLLSNSEKPVPTILICLLIWSLPVLANFLPLLPFFSYIETTLTLLGLEHLTLCHSLFPPHGRSLYYPVHGLVPVPNHPPYGSCPLFAGAQALITGSSPCVDTLFTPQALNPHSRLILTWGSTHMAWAPTFHTGCPSWGYLPCPAWVLTTLLEPWGLLLPWHGCLLVLPKRKRYPLLLLQFYIEKGKLGSIDFINSN